MDTDQRIAMLVLAGCATYRFDMEVGQYHTCIAQSIRESLHPILERVYETKAFASWQIYERVVSGFPAPSLQVPWDTGLIATIPEELFLKYIELLTT